MSESTVTDSVEPVAKERAKAKEPPPPITTRFVGIGIGKHTYTVVIIDPPKVEDGDPEVELKYVANSVQGIEDLLSLIGDTTKVSFLGNHRWGTPFAQACVKKGLEPRYFRVKQERGARGPAGNVGTLVKNILLAGKATPQDYFNTKSGPRRELPSQYRRTDEYLEITNDVCRLKHRILDLLALLFPEVVKADKKSKKGPDGQDIVLPVPFPQPSDLWTKKMATVLENPDPFVLEKGGDKIPDEVVELAKVSLGRFVDEDTRQATLEAFGTIVKEYYAKVVSKANKLKAVKKAVKKHPMITGDTALTGDTAVILCGLLGWRKWQHWRELRHFCGLDVSTVDSRGKPRISRVRPRTRQYLYLMATLTNNGKKVTALPKGTKHSRVKKCEKMLKWLWQNFLRDHDPHV